LCKYRQLQLENPAYPFGNSGNSGNSGGAGHAPVELNIRALWLSDLSRLEHPSWAHHSMTTFLFSLATLGAALWLRHLTLARPRVLARIQRQRRTFRGPKS
jgi:hypothetical protein